MEERIIAYKGFNKNLTCLGFQYEIGKEYHQEGKIEVCENGFHACRNPLDVLIYYGDCHNDRYCVVEVYGEVMDCNENTKLAASDIKIVSEISLKELIVLGSSWLKNNSKNIICPFNIPTSQTFFTYKDDNTTSYCEVPNLKISNKGDNSTIGNIGCHAWVKNCSSQSTISNSGDYSSIYSTGTFNYILNIGEYVQINDVGIAGRIMCCGKYSRITNESSNTKIYSSGDYVKINCMGSFCEVNSTGKNAVIVCTGRFTYVKAMKGSEITLTEWCKDSKVDEWLPKCTKSTIVDGEYIKEGVAYTIKNGQFVEADKKETGQLPLS